MSFIQKRHGASLGNTNSMPWSAGSDAESLKPCVRRSTVSATTTDKCAVPSVSATVRGRSASTAIITATAITPAAVLTITRRVLGADSVFFASSFGVEFDILDDFFSDISSRYFFYSEPW